MGCSRTCFFWNIWPKLAALAHPAADVGVQPLKKTEVFGCFGWALGKPQGEIRKVCDFFFAIHGRILVTFLPTPWLHCYTPLIKYGTPEAESLPEHFPIGQVIFGGAMIAEYAVVCHVDRGRCDILQT